MPLKAIDCHVHPWDETSLGFMGAGRLEAMSRYFGRDIKPVPFDELADTYRAREMMAVLLAIGKLPRLAALTLAASLVPPRSPATPSGAWPSPARARSRRSISTRTWR